MSFNSAASNFVGIPIDVADQSSHLNTVSGFLTQVFASDGDVFEKVHYGDAQLTALFDSFAVFPERSSQVPNYVHKMSEALAAQIVQRIYAVGA